MSYSYPADADGRALTFPHESLKVAGTNTGTNTAAQSRKHLPMEAVNGSSSVPLDPRPVSPTTSPATNKCRNIVFPDPVAFRYIEEDDAVQVVERRGILRGYELYLVEQWACSRLSPTLVIVTYTGDEEHSVVVGVLSVPEDSEKWSPRLRVYFKALEQSHARPKDTPLGELMVTNLSSFPSACTVIPVPDGDIKQHRQVFIVNEDLKRLGCSGRSGMTLAEPTNATLSKFYQLYKVCDTIPFFDAVIELVKLCQVALLLFGKLEHEYIDGLLCDKTEAAISNWWTEVGSQYYNAEPTDGILGPTTVAALFGMLMGARNRLASASAPVSKDVFDVDSTKRGIGAFQKAHKLERSRRLDRQTLLKLYKVTAKAAAGETWGVQKAVKSTVAEIGGKRGELVIDMVGGRNKGGIGDIETLDMDTFISLAAGERAKWLWYGKRRRAGTGAELLEKAMPLGMGDLPFKDDSTPAKQTTKKPSVEDAKEARVKEQSPVPSTVPTLNSVSTGLESPLVAAEKRRTVFKSVAGKMSDARSGLGRIKDAVGGGLRGHGSRPSRDEPFGTYGIAALGESAAMATAVSSPTTAGRAFTWKQKPEEYFAALKRAEVDSLPTSPSNPQKEKEKEYQSLTAGAASVGELSQKSLPTDLRPTLSATSGAGIRKEIVSSPPSVGGSVVDEKDLRGPILYEEQGANTNLASFHRRHSISHHPHRELNEACWPRRMSFSDAEEAVLVWEDIYQPFDTNNPACPLDRTAARSLYTDILSVKENIEPWVLAKLAAIENLDVTFAKSQEELQTLYYQLSEAYQRTKEESQELVAEQRMYVKEAINDVEVLVARLDYEIDALVSKVQEVEEGVTQFEREVDNVERRADDLKVQLETESWLHWFIRTLTGIGTGPNITRRDD